MKIKDHILNILIKITIYESKLYKNMDIYESFQIENHVVGRVR